MLAKLSALHFRNLAPLDWQPGPGSHLLLGDNGAGKTSLLEAIYALATTRSFRTSRMADCVAHAETSLHLSGEIEGPARVLLELSWHEGKSSRRLNGSAVPLAEHLAAQPVVAWTQKDIEILNGPPELRRRFLDRGVIGIQPAALDLLARYRRTLDHKRQLLFETDAALETWNEMLARLAVDVIRQRQAYVERLQRAFETVLEVFALDFSAVQLVYRPSPAREWDSAEGILRALERAAPQERLRRLPLVGPHRDDLEVRWDRHELRRVASAGERKTVALALLAGHGQVLEAHDRRPIYLLDDADTELSAGTLKAVWRGFRGSEQVLASSNRPDVWEALDLDHRWCLEDGRLLPAQRAGAEA